MKRVTITVWYSDALGWYISDKDSPRQSKVAFVTKAAARLLIKAFDMQGAIYRYGEHLGNRISHAFWLAESGSLFEMETLFWEGPKPTKRAICCICNKPEDDYSATGCQCLPF